MEATEKYFGGDWQEHFEAEKMAQWLRLLGALPESLSSVSTTHVKWYLTACNSSSS